MSIYQQRNFAFSSAIGLYLNLFWSFRDSTIDTWFKHFTFSGHFINIFSVSAEASGWELDQNQIWIYIIIKLCFCHRMELGLFFLCAYTAMPLPGPDIQTYHAIHPVAEAIRCLARYYIAIVITWTVLCLSRHYAHTNFSCVWGKVSRGSGSAFPKLCTLFGVFISMPISFTIRRSFYSYWWRMIYYQTLLVFPHEFVEIFLLKLIPKLTEN